MAESRVVVSEVVAFLGGSFENVLLVKDGKGPYALSAWKWPLSAPRGVHDPTLKDIVLKWKAVWQTKCLNGS